MITNFDRVQESKINLHGPSLPNNHSLGRGDERVGDIRRAIQASTCPGNVSQESID